MRIQQRVRNAGQWSAAGEIPGREVQLVLAFGSGTLLRNETIWQELHELYPGAQIAACSTAGEIAGAQVLDDSLVVTGVSFKHSRVATASVRLDDAADSKALGSLLASRLPHEDLVHVLVLSDGLKVNGSALVAGLSEQLPPQVAVTGGLAGDGANFVRTTVCLNGCTDFEQIVAIGLYGSRLHVGHGSLGGWDPFGIERRITRSEGNVLYELDGEPALDLYKRYLAEYARDLPASGLLFPLALRGPVGDDAPVVRTILAVDEKARTLTFAGDVPAGHRARLMRANFERLIEGASGAAHAALRGPAADAQLAILISCVGRKLVLKQRVEEEVEAVRDVLGKRAVLAGFYSYGEISPLLPQARCELHNQTMTITTLSEA